MELSNREIAQAIYLGLGIILVALFPDTRKPLLSLLRAFFTRKILIPLALYFSYAGLLVLLGYRYNLWNISLIKETIFVIIFIGIPVLSQAILSKNGTNIFKQTVNKTLGISALLGFYLGLDSFPLWGEMLLLPFIIFCVGMIAAEKSLSGDEKKITPFKCLMAVLGIFLFFYTSVRIIRNFHDYDWGSVLDSFLLNLCFAIALAPLIYVFAFIASCETVLVMLPFFNNKETPKLRARIAFVLGVRFSTRLPKLFGGRWRKEIATSETFRESWDIMRRFRREVKS